VPRDHSVVAERGAWLDHSGCDAGNAFPRDVNLEGAREMLILGQEYTAALYAAIKVAAEALSRAGGGRIRTLEVGVRVVRRSGQGRGESRSDWVRRRAGPPVSGSFFRDRSAVIRGGSPRRRRRHRHRRCRRRGVDVSFLDGVFCARRCLDFFRLGGVLAASRVI